MEHLDKLARDIATFGIVQYEDEVLAFADSVYRRGIAPALVGILADQANPPFARERAFARLLATVRNEQALDLVRAA